MSDADVPRPTPSGAGVRAVIEGVEYAVGIDHVVGVTVASTWARLPGAPAAVVGLTAVRGRPVVVLDPAVLLGAGTGDPAGEILLVEVDGATVGVLVERVVVDRGDDEPAGDSVGDSVGELVDDLTPLDLHGLVAAVRRA